MPKRSSFITLDSAFHLLVQKHSPSSPSVERDAHLLKANDLRRSNLKRSCVDADLVNSGPIQKVGLKEGDCQTAAQL